VLCGYAAVAGDLGVAAVLGATFAVLLSLAQRVLSSHVRLVRRRATAVRGEIELADGTRSEIDAALLIAPAERALGLLTVATIALAVTMVAFRVCVKSLHVHRRLILTGVLAAAVLAIALR
jgi:hypothetical protein